MKTNKILSFFAIVAIALAFTSCVQDDDYAVPESLGEEENSRLQILIDSARVVDFDYVKGFYNNDPNDDDDNNDAIPYEFVDDEDTAADDIYIIGYVSSSDRTGNFFKEFYIQDSPTNPTSALKVVLNQVDSYNQFNFGRQVYIKLNGLYIGEERTGNGIYTIGGDTEFDQFGGTVMQLNENQIRDNVLRSTVTEEMVPLTVTFSEITDDYVGFYVQIDNVEFADDLNGERYFDSEQVFDTRRSLQICNGANYSVLPLETSSFASFKAQFLPVGNGTIKAVVSKTFDGSAHVLALNDVADVDMDGPRCALAQTIFQENFNTAIDGTNLDLTGWLNVATAGNRVWREEVFSGNGYAEFNPFGSGNASNITWMITPSIDMDAFDGEVLTFQTAHAYPDAGHDPLAVYVSTDFDGVAANIGNATWTPLDFATSYEIDSDTWNTFRDSGDIDLSTYTGTGYLAFVYTGSDTANQNMTLRVDNIAIAGQ
ncbi:MAG: DUF5689 domain-containing protein [Aquaticitalea sp.]